MAAAGDDEYEIGEIKYPTGFGLKDIAGWGSTGLVVLDKASSTVVKTAHDNDELVERERQVYERFTERGGHPNLLRYHGTFERGIRLEHAPQYHLSSLIREPGDEEEVTSEQRVRWATQVADALGFVHNAGVIHSDVKLGNVLLGAELDAKLTDFAGSSIDGGPLLIGVAQNHQYPGELVSVKADIFSLGCLIYELITGTFPHEGQSDKDIKDWYSRGIFPDTKALGPAGSVITKCWQGRYRQHNLLPIGCESLSKLLSASDKSLKRLSGLSLEAGWINEEGCSSPVALEVDRKRSRNAFSISVKSASSRLLANLVKSQSLA